MCFRRYAAVFDWTTGFEVERYDFQAPFSTAKFSPDRSIVALQIGDWPERVRVNIVNLQSRNTLFSCTLAHRQTFCFSADSQSFGFFNRACDIRMVPPKSTLSNSPSKRLDMTSQCLHHLTNEQQPTTMSKDRSKRARKTEKKKLCVSDSLA